MTGLTKAQQRVLDFIQAEVHAARSVPTLREIARSRPQSLEALRGISGIGARKLEAYGEDIVGLVRAA